MENKSLVEISKELQVIEEQIILAQGEISEELEKIVADVQAHLEGKIDSYHWVIKGLESRADLFKEQAKQYQKVARGIESRSDFLRDTIKKVMRERSKFEIEGTEIRYKLQTTNKTLVIDDPSKIPSDLKIVTTSPDNEKIKDLMLKGVEVPGCRLEENFSLKSYAKRK